MRRAEWPPSRVKCRSPPALRVNCKGCEGRARQGCRDQCPPQVQANRAAGRCLQAAQPWQRKAQGQQQRQRQDIDAHTVVLSQQQQPSASAFAALRQPAVGAHLRPKLGQLQHVARPLPAHHVHRAANEARAQERSTSAHAEHAWQAGRLQGSLRLVPPTIQPSQRKCRRCSSAATAQLRGPTPSSGSAEGPQPPLPPAHLRSFSQAPATMVSCTCASTESSGSSTAQMPPCSSNQSTHGLTRQAGRRIQRVEHRADCGGADRWEGPGLSAGNSCSPCSCVCAQPATVPCRHPPKPPLHTQNNLSTLLLHTAHLGVRGAALVGGCLGDDRHPAVLRHLERVAQARNAGAEHNKVKMLHCGGAVGDAVAGGSGAAAAVEAGAAVGARGGCCHAAAAAGCCSRARRCRGRQAQGAGAVNPNVSRGAGAAAGPAAAAKRPPVGARRRGGGPGCPSTFGGVCGAWVLILISGVSARK